MTARRGVALLAALWLVVAIATVALQFSLEARERRSVGILAGERGIQRGLAQGAFEMTRARMEQDLRVLPSGNNAIDRLRASDPWLDASSRYSGDVYVDSTPVDVQTVDLSSFLNINSANELEFQTFFSFLLRDFERSTKLAQAIMDWRDADTLPRPSGGEIEAYLKAELLALPTNAPFRDVDDMRNVLGMNDTIFTAIRPYLTTRGNGRVNVNTAPAAVLRALPGMTDAILSAILQYRSQGRRINNMTDVMGRAAVNPQLQGRIVYSTTNVELDITARTGPQSSPTKLIVVLTRGEGGNVNVTNTIW